ncbi:MAG TPA: prefoldin subunit beta [Candidatus Nanoarchaeia archaeon]|nr:prefoldin subunit beta [Candidatus Nanoarchaeia archaeon]
MVSQEKLQEMQIIEQSLNNVLMQKNVFQMELSETDSALTEIEKSSGEVFKVIGQLMIKTEKEKIKNDLSNKKKLIELRLKNLEKQEASLSDKLEDVRDDLMPDLK